LEISKTTSPQKKKCKKKIKKKEQTKNNTVSIVQYMRRWELGV
jgi:hypothetical protein